MSRSLFPLTKIMGVTAQDGKRYVVIKHETDKWAVPHKLLTTDMQRALADLRARELPLLGRPFSAFLQAELAQLRSPFQRQTLFLATGWNDPVFVKSNGEGVYPPLQPGDDTEQPAIAFRTDNDKYESSDTLPHWKRTAHKYVDHYFAVLAIAAALAPVVRPLVSQPGTPFGIEFHGPHEQTSPIHDLIAWTSGLRKRNSHRGQLIPDLMDDPQAVLAVCHDLPLALAPIEVFIGGKKRERERLMILIDQHLLSSGEDDANIYGHRAPMFLYQSGGSLLEHAVNQARFSRHILSIKLRDRRYHQQVVEHLDDAQANDLNPLSFPHWVPNHHHDGGGAALAELIQALVNENARDSRRLRDRLDWWIDEFVKDAEARVGGAFEHEHARQARRFGLFYATLEIAKELGVLPKTFTPRESIDMAYAEWFGTQPKKPKLRDILLGLEGRIVDLQDVEGSTKRLGKSLKEALADRSAVIGHGKQPPRRRMWVFSDQVEETLGMPWKEVKKLDDFSQYYIESKDPGHGDKRKISTGIKARVHSFHLIDG